MKHSIEESVARINRAEAFYRHRYEADPEGERLRFACLETNLRIIQARLEEFHAWSREPAAADACRILDKALHLGATKPHLAPWRRSLIASTLGLLAHDCLAKRFSRQVVEALFEPDELVVLFGERAIAPSMPREGPFPAS